jgi:hypothetical protein
LFVQKKSTERIEPKESKKEKEESKGKVASRTDGQKFSELQSMKDFHSHSCPDNDLRGLRAAREMSIAVTFHCIVPKPIWLWDKDSCIHMRFQGQDLGDWKKNVGNFMDKRTDEDGNCEMECTLFINAELLKSPLGYKYVIYSPKATDEDDLFEKLHPFIVWRDDPNRCLMPSEIRGGFQQYDSFVYPPEMKVPKRFYEQMRDSRIGNFLFGRRSQTGNVAEMEMKVPDRNDMTIQSLHFYLRPFIDAMLSEKFGDIVDVSNVAEIFFKLHWLYLQYNGNVKMERLSGDLLRKVFSCTE